MRCLGREEFVLRPVAPTFGVLVVAITLLTSALPADAAEGAALVGKPAPALAFIAAPQLPLDIVPLRAAPLADGPGALYAAVDQAGIAGVDGLPTSWFVPLHDPAVCGSACRVPSTTFGDEGNFYFCMSAASGQPAWPWRWSSGVSAPGTPGCTTVASSTVVVNTNGFITHPALALCSGSACYTPTNLPATTAPHAGVYGLWADLDNSCTTGTNGFYTAWGGTAPDRFWIWQWQNVPKYPCSTSAAGATFQIILFEATNEVEVHYGASTGFSAVYAAGEENSGTTSTTITGLQFARATTAAAPPRNNGIAYYDAVAPVVTAVTVTCGTAGTNGWCRSATNSVRITDNNDVAPGGKVGMGIRSRTWTLDDGAPAGYANNSLFSVSAADGVHSIVARAQDHGLNVGTLTRELRVDATPPIIVPVLDITAEATGPSGAAVSWTTGATDATSGVASFSCSRVSGSVFALGETSVACTATDAAGNQATMPFKVRVVDTTPPAIAPMNDVFVPYEGGDGVVVEYDAPATTDAVDGPGVASCAPPSGSLFGPGVTLVTCTATDNAGNTATSTFTITVGDAVAPVIEPVDDVTAEATGPDGAIVVYAAPATSDNVDPPGVATCSPPSGSLFALGSTLVTCTASDASGNEAIPVTFSVHVVDTTPPIIVPVASAVMSSTGTMIGGVASTRSSR
ncbi:MAG TPA: HYR domain-containing protein, partial [Candidatus Thermoplasmatota archaeon]|nr:HYR domain-containing protein [Candidatus Thermoplasmatota archaeon]